MVAIWAILPPMKTSAALGVVAVLAGLPVAAQNASDAIEILPVHGQVSLLAGPVSNSLVQVGPQGVLVVDTMRAEDAPPLLAAIRKIAAGRPIRYVVDTHVHADHTGGNATIGQAGSQLVAGNFAGQVGQAAANAAFIVAHENVLTAMSAPTGSVAPTPPAAWPTETFFQAEKDMYFNGEGIQLVYEPHAHTDGDIMVFFRGSDVIAAGDVFDTTAYPRIDLTHGGHVNGIIEALNRLVDLAISEQFTEGGTRIVPGHGRICDEFDVVEYRDMMTIIRDRVQAMIARHMSLEQVQAARPTFDYDTRYGSTTGPWTTAMFVEAIYRNLTPPPAAAGRGAGRGEKKR
jgi:glyoxylase-like metal-dependent hydrolase (beta-lactamase superfamily II)